jgi:transposase InsO family protein
MVYYPEAIDAFPLEFRSLAQAQLVDPEIQAKLQSGDYVTTTYGDIDLATKTINNEPRIVVPADLHGPTVHWYHAILGHAGQDRLYKSLVKHLHILGLKDLIKTHVESCDRCQRYKTNGPGYGHLPPRDDLPAPFHEVALDHIGPWTLNVPEFGSIKFEALTMIDIASTLCEIVRVESTSGDATAMYFENTWLSRYPKPIRAIFDAGSAFHSPEFKLSLHRNGIEPVPITVKNPQSNAICERAHRTIGDQIRPLQEEEPPQTVASAYDAVDSILATSQRAIRSAVNVSLGVAPGAMIFHRDMLMDLPVHVDLDQAQQRRQEIANRNNEIENSRRRTKNYVVGDEVMILAHRPTRMGARAIGPFVITQVHVNGTVTIRRRPNVLERINIRRLKPYTRRA